MYKQHKHASLSFFWSLTPHSWWKKSFSHDYFSSFDDDDEAEAKNNYYYESDDDSTHDNGTFAAVSSMASVLRDENPLAAFRYRTENFRQHFH